MKVIKDILALLAVCTLAGLGVIAAFILALYCTNVWVAPLPIEANTSVLSVPSSLEVVNNYGEQKTADIHVIEPKVSDAYLQWGAL